VYQLPLILPISYAIVATFLFLVPIVTLDSDNYEANLPQVGGALVVVVTGIPVYFLLVKKVHPRLTFLYDVHGTGTGNSRVLVSMQFVT
jgi:hypothetical protein